MRGVTENTGTTHRDCPAWTRRAPSVLRGGVLAAAVVLVAALPEPATGAWGDTYYWKSDASSGFWNQDWWKGANENPGGNPGGGKLQFDNAAFLAMTNDWTGSAANRWQILFLDGTGSRTIAGSTENVFYDSGGTGPKIENNDGDAQTINFPLNIGYSGGLQINPVNGDLSLGGALNNNGYDVLVYGDNSKMLTLGGVVSGSGKLIVKQYSKVKLTGASTMTGNVEIDRGEVWMDAGSALGAGTIYVGNGVQLADVAKLWLSDSDGGLTVTRAVSVNNGNSGTRYVGGLNSSGTNTFGGAVSLSGDVVLQADQAGGAIEFTNVISGAQNVTLSGPGKVRLTAANTFSGTLYLDGGTLEIERGGDALNAGEIKLGYQTGDVTLRLISTGGLLLDNPINVRSTSGAKSLWHVSGTATNTASVYLDADLLLTNSGAKLVLTGSEFDLKGNVLTVAGVGATVVSNVVKNTSGTGRLVKRGSGQLSLLAANTYSGATTNLGGTIFINADASLGTAPASQTPGHLTLDGGTLYHGDFSSITLNTNRGVALGAGGGTLQVASSRTLTYGGIVAGAGDLTKTGAGTLALTGPNAYTGRTLVNDGTVRVNDEQRLGANPAGFTADQLTLNGGTLQANGSFTMDDSNRGVTVGTSGGTFDVNSGVTLAVAVPTAGSGSLTKSGLGVLTLNGSNSYVGATIVTNGTLVYNGTNAATAVTLSSNATLRGTGRIGDTTAGVGAEIDPGTNTASVGGLSVGTFALGGGAKLRVNLGNCGDTSSRDYIACTGTVTVSGTATVIVDSAAASNFTNTHAKSWNIVVGGVSSTNGLALDQTTSWALDKAGGAFSLSAAGGNLQLQFAPAGTYPPTVTNATVSLITHEGATLGAEITDDGASAILARGTVWDTSATPAANELAEGGTTTGVFSHARSGMPSGTLIYYRGWASNAIGKSYSADGSFWTVPPAPGTRPATNISTTAFNANWFAATGATNYFLDVATDSGFTAYASGWSNVSVGSVTTAVVNSGIGSATAYFYRLRAQNSGGTSTNSATVTLTTEPDQATGITFAAVAKTAMTVSWTGGNGAGRILVARQGAAVSWLPTDGTAPSGVNTNYGSASDQGGGRILYDGTGSMATVAGLTLNTTYYYRVFEYVGSGASINYNTNAAAGNPASQATLDDEPGIVVAPAAISVTTMVGATPSARSLAVTNAGGSLLSYTLTTNASWLSTAPSSGASLPHGSGLTHTVSFNASGLSAGVVSGIVTVTSTGVGQNAATNGPVNVPVTLTLTNIPGPTQQSAAADGPEMVWLSWTKNPGYDVLVVHRAGAAPGDPVQGQSYDVGQSCGGGGVIYKGAAGTAEHVGAPGSTNYYRFFSVYNSHYSTGLTAVATNETYRPDEIVDAFAYTNGTTLNGLNGGHGWTNAWIESTAGRYVAYEHTFSNFSGYLPNHGNKVQVVPGAGESHSARRGFEPVTNGAVMASFIMNYQWGTFDKFIGLSFMDGDTEKCFVGKIYTSEKALSLQAGTQVVYSAYDLVPGYGQDYIVFGKYDFDTRRLAAKAYFINTDSLPTREPVWETSMVLPAGQVTRIDGIRIGAGGGPGATPGQTYFDEIRVGRTWGDLVNHLIAFQGFEWTGDSWGYTTAPGLGAIDAVTERHSSGYHALRLAGSTNNSDPSVTFTNINLVGYTNVVLSIAYAADGPDSGDDLEFWISTNGGTFVKLGYVDGFNNLNFDFGGTPHDDGTSITANPYTYSVSPGARSITLMIVYNESSGNNNTGDYWYTDDVKLTGGAAPEMDVLGASGASIACGDATPSGADGTDFGSAEAAGATAEHTFSVTNEGLAVLNLAGTPRVAIAGHTGDFSVISAPTATVAAAGARTDFVLRFAPQALGVRTALVSIASDDVDENPYTFAVQGTGTPAAEPAMNASGLTFSAATNVGMTVSWTPGNGTNRIVVARQGAAVSGVPADGTVYAANATFGSGGAITTGEYVVYNGSGTSVAVSGLLPGTTYHFTVFEYNGAAAGVNYLTAGALAGSHATATYAPVISEGATVQVTMSENGSPTAFAVSLSATDPDPGDTLTWSLRNSPERGSAAATGTGASPGAVTYVPDLYFAGADSFVVQVTDSFGNQDTVIVQVTVSPVNLPGRAVFIFE
jgi:autotransporter-associated beta strand protein